MIEYVFSDIAVCLGLMAVFAGVGALVVEFCGKTYFGADHKGSFLAFGVACLIAGLLATTVSVGLRIDQFNRHQRALVFLDANKSVFALSVDFARQRDYVPRLESDYATCKKLADILNDLSATKPYSPRYDCDLKLLGADNEAKQ